MSDHSDSRADAQSSSAFQHLIQPFSDGVSRLLPPKGVGMRVRSKRNDRIPDEGSSQPLVNEYHSIDDPTLRLRVPKKVATPVKVEAKVWFANERTFISYLSTGLLLSTIASGLLFGSRDSLARHFALAYAFISVGILVYGWTTYQRRLTLISARDGGGFDMLWGPVTICVALFVAILVNFVLRVQESHRETGVSPLAFSKS